MKKVLSFIALAVAIISCASCNDAVSSESDSKTDSLKHATVIDTPQKAFITEYSHVKTVEDSVETDKDSFTIRFVLKNGTKHDVSFRASDNWKKGSGGGDLTDSPVLTPKLKTVYEEIKKAKAADFYLVFNGNELFKVGLLPKTTEGKDGVTGTYVPPKVVWNAGYVSFSTM